MCVVQEAAWTVTDECIQIMGGMGFMKVRDQPTSRSCASPTVLCETNQDDYFQLKMSFLSSHNTFSTERPIFTTVSKTKTLILTICCEP